MQPQSSKWPSLAQCWCPLNPSWSATGFMWSPPSQPADLQLLIQSQFQMGKAADGLVQLLLLLLSESNVRVTCFHPKWAGACGQDLHLKCISASLCVWESCIGTLKWDSRFCVKKNWEHNIVGGGGDKHLLGGVNSTVQLLLKFQPQKHITGFETKNSQAWTSQKERDRKKPRKWSNSFQ